MKQEEQPLSDAQIAAERLRNLKPHSEYKPVEGIPIPAQNGVLVKQLIKPKVFETLVDLEGGGSQKLFGSTGNNTQDTCEGIIMSVGPKCSNDPRVGLKIQYSSAISNNGTKFIHKGKEYLAMDEYSILFYMPDESTIVDNGVKPPSQLRREKKIPLQQKTLDNVYRHEQNEMDKQKDKTKGKVKKMK
ncbi:MAG: hypothetical protein WC055_02335 [Melioribacteraceae bacterium]